MSADALAHHGIDLQDKEKAVFCMRQDSTINVWRNDGKHEYIYVPQNDTAYKR